MQHVAVATNVLQRLFDAVLLADRTGSNYMVPNRFGGYPLTRRLSLRFLPSLPHLCVLSVLCLGGLERLCYKLTGILSVSEPHVSSDTATRRRDVDLLVRGRARVRVHSRHERVGVLSREVLSDAAGLAEGPCDEDGEA